MSFYGNNQKIDFQKSDEKEIKQEEYYDYLENAILDSYKSGKDVRDLPQTGVKIYNGTLAGCLYELYDNESENMHVEINLKKLDNNKFLQLVHQKKKIPK